MSKPLILELKEKIVELEEKLKKEILYENEEGTNADVTLNDTVENYAEIEIFFDNDRSSSQGEKIFSSTKVINPNGKYVTLETSKAGSTYIYLHGQEYKILANKLSVVHFYNLIFNSNTIETKIDHQGFIRIFKIHLF